jgi:Ca2+-binding RTX toxin-like protein
VRATGGDGENTFAFYGNHTNLNVELTITDFKSGQDKIDISKLLGNNFDGSKLTQALANKSAGQTIDLSSLTADTNDHITLQLTNGVVLTSSDFNTDVSKATWFDQIDRLVKDQITEITEVSLVGQGGVVLGQLEAGIAKREAFIGSTADDRVIANGGADIFSNFQGADTFLGGADGVVLLNQTNYLHANESTTPYLHIEQITGLDLKNTLDPQMAGSVATNLLGLRIVDDVVNQITGSETKTTGFAQAGFVKLYKDGLVTDTIKVGAIAEANANGLTLSNLDHFFLAGMGNDVVLGGTGADVIVGNGGNDWINGGAGNNILAGGSWDVVTSSSDTPFGPIATDYVSTLVGSVGDDVLVAIEGKVRATGGDGENTFAFYGNHTNLNVELTITDFKSGQDKIDLSKLLGNPPAAFDLGTYLLAHKTIDANGLHFDLSGLIAQPEGAASNQSNVILTIANAANPANAATLANPEGQISTPVLGDFVTNLAGTDLWFDQLQPLVYPT